MTGITNEKASSRYTILVVDDLEINRTLLKTILADDYEVIEARNGVEALELIKKSGEAISLIISDNHMDEMDGLELLGHLSKNPWLKRIPVIMVSADQTMEFVNEAYALGAADFIFLPFVPKLVLHRVKYTLENYLRHKEEMLHSVHTLGELCFVLMQIDLKNDTCEIFDTSEYKDMWDKDILLCASKTIRLFTKYGYIHPEDLPEFLEFTDPKRLQKLFLSGTVKTHFRYRRNYRGNYRWALMEVIRTSEYSPENQTVVMFSRDIQEEVDEQNKSFDVIAARSVSTDYCNISRDCLYHNERANYVSDNLKEFDTVTQALTWAAERIQDKTCREQYLRMFSGKNLLEAYDNGQKVVSFEHPYRTPELGIKVFRTSVQLFQNIHTKDIEGIYYVEDISMEFVHRRIAENIFYHDYEFVGIWDTEYGDMYVHKTGEDLYNSENRLRVPYQEVIDFRRDRLYVQPEEYQKITSAEYVLQRLEEAEEYSFTLETVSGKGRPFTLEYVYRYFLKEDHAVALMIRNITAAAERDSVTEGMNKKGFNREVEWFLAGHRRQEYAILYFDIQDFKAINELLGFEGGNEILKKACRLLADSPLKPEFTARAMADQFVCLVKRSRIRKQVLSQICRTDIKNQKLPIVLRMHCGIYDIRSDDLDVRSMCDKAKIALKKVENEYTNPYRWFEHDMNQRYLEQIHVVNHIAHALENKEFVVFYQPIYEAATEKLISAEALIRWRNKKNGYVRPDIFIPVLEEKGIISRLDWYVAEEVNRFMLAQKAQGLPYIPVSINLSRMDFYDKKMMHSVYEMIECSEIEPQYFKIEITESSFADVSKLDRFFLKMLRDKGCKILIDDFGTGYSSLLSVAKQQFDLLKIDQSFVREIGRDVQVEAVIHSIIDMTHRMNARTVAEGVETREQFEFLRDNGCDYIQGYYFSKPISAEEFRTLLNTLK